MHTQDIKLQTILKVKDLKTWFPIKSGILARKVEYIRALDGVSFNIQKGETLAIVGESGCGKTTLGRTLLGLEKAREGTITFKGKDILALKHRQMRELRKKMQIIFQDPLSSLNPRMNILEILTEGLVEFRMIKGSIQDHANRLLKDVGLDKDAFYRYPHEFSGGQCQRISIARAVSLRPDFIVCDEPVSALDVSVQAQIINLLMDLRDRYSLSYLFISHDLSVVSYIANSVAVMYSGQIVEQGPVEDIIHDPKHPYTKALIAAVPTPGIQRKKPVALKEGVLSLAQHISQCGFQDRCGESMGICKKKSSLTNRFGWAYGSLSSIYIRR